ncbi:MMPL family transporter [Spartinivicinus poritis]|uniref:Membrane transport protein MMPL domain-containing protein n=1 Tax=Spartinivicinus poritis TaxID=2994640 RepID=A0ABT5U1W7_9GAMM|nr:hypothetical protein [Spartinivicinus sp. A2-2]MDE1460353.1 hypothetical protein [Spartinivicinus sp. A2-2]
MAAINKPKGLFTAWLLLIVGSLILLFTQLQQGIPLKMDILELLPQVEQPEASKQQRPSQVFIDRSVKAVANKVLLLVGHSDKQTALSQARQLHQTLTQHAAVTDSFFQLDQDNLQSIAKLYFPYRFGLLAEKTVSQLESRDIDKLVANAQQQLYSPLSAANSKLIQNDPLFLFYDFLTQLPAVNSNLQLEEGYLLAQADSQTYVLMTLVLTDEYKQQLSFVNDIQQVEQQLQAKSPDLTLLKAGVAFHKAYGEQSAKADISLISIGSMLGIILLVLVLFRSIKPLLLTLFTIATGVLVAFTVTLLIFGELHIIALVFGASLIGISIDYAFHYLAKQYTASDNWHPAKCIRAILPGLGLGLFTSVVGYIPMVTAPFPGLQQMGVFSIVGLTVAFITVVVAYPVLSAKGFYRPGLGVLGQWLNNYLVKWQQQNTGLKATITLGLLLIALAGVTQLTADDDVKKLQALSEQLLQEQQKIQAITGFADVGPYVIIFANNTEQLLLREQQFVKQLRQANQSVVGEFIALSDYIPAMAIQQQHYQLLARLVEVGENASNSIWRKLTELGYQTPVVEQYQQELLAAKGYALNFNDWFAAFPNQWVKALWLGESQDQPSSNKQVASVIRFNHITDYQTLVNLVAEQQAGVALIDQARTVSTTFASYRMQLVKLVAIAYLLIAVFLWFRYGWKDALFILMPPLIAALLAITSIAQVVGYYNLFNCLALILVLSIGIDYTLFIKESDSHSLSATFTAVALSACTTLLSFGLLALSDIPVVFSFGLTISVGIGCAFILAPLAAKQVSK